MFGHRTGTNFKTPDKKYLKFTEAVYGAFESEAKLAIGFPLHRYIKTPELRKFYRALDVISKFTLDFMEKIKNSPSSLPAGYECLFEKFKREEKLTDDEIIQVAITLLAGGVDTSATMLVSTLFMLSKSQRAQEKLFEEINSVLPNGQTPNYDSLNKLPFLKATINEVFRTSPVTVGTTRQLSKPIVLGGYEIPAGVIITLSTGFKSTQMETQTYGDVENFRPERWLRGNKDFHPFAVLPFGFGPRMCVGRRIAVMELSLFLVRFLQKYKVEENNLPEDQLGWHFGIVQRPDRPCNLYLSAR
jgi:cytochrome P450